MILSYSQIWTFRYCPKRYLFRYVEKLPESLSWQASFGTSVHNALYRFVQEIRGKNLWSSLEDFHPQVQQSLFGESVSDEGIHPELSRLIELLDSSWVSTGFESQEHMYEQKCEAIALLEEWFAKNHQTIAFIQAVELSFKLPLGEAVLSGRFDRIDQIDNQLVVVDYKSGAKRTQEDVDTDTQLALYALVLQEKLGIDRVDLALYFLRDNSIVQTFMTRQQTAPVRELVINTSKSISSHDFSPTPSLPTCTHCPYRSICTDAILS